MNRSAYPSLSEINVTNLVDVVLVLLIIFMLTAPFLQGGVDLDLPKADAEPLPTNEGLVISVFPDKSVMVDDRSVKLDDLEAHLKLVHPAGTKSPVYLRADQNLPYGFIVQLMTIMNKAGLENVGLVSEPLLEEVPRGR
jgi:biopolymer transport protein TolR